MNIIEFILCKLFYTINIFKEVDPATGKRIYLRRWFLEFGPDGKIHWYNHAIIFLMKWFGIIHAQFREPYLHKVFMSDDDKDPHDHPWDFETRVLWNGYNDESYQIGDSYFWGPLRMGPYVDKLRFFSRRTRPADWIHQVKKRNDKPTWTLVIRGPFKREWGFWTAAGQFIPSHDYLGLSKDADPYPFDVEMFKV